MARSETPTTKTIDVEPVSTEPWDQGEEFTPGLFRFFLAWMGVPLLVAIAYVLIVDGV